MIVMIIIAVPILKSAKHFTKTILGLEGRHGTERCENFTMSLVFLFLLCFCFLCYVWLNVKMNVNHGINAPQWCSCKRRKEKKRYLCIAALCYNSQGKEQTRLHFLRKLIMGVNEVAQYNTWHDQVDSVFTDVYNLKHISVFLWVLVLHFFF